MKKLDFKSLPVGTLVHDGMSTFFRKVADDGGRLDWDDLGTTSWGDGDHVSSNYLQGEQDNDGVQFYILVRKDDAE